ncbi:hypothetical protein WH7805_11208 [Synechococcus sp. WH 7805]|nr:hypothetical protein WH7805_11208 [Synechococcus sp. WH 7805]
MQELELMDTSSNGLMNAGDAFDAVTTSEDGVTASHHCDLNT